MYISRKRQKTEQNEQINPIVDAVRKGSYALVCQALIENAFIRLDDLNSAMCIACGRGFTRIATELLEAGAEMNVDALIPAVRNNRIKCVQLILPYVSTTAKSEAMLLACKNNNITIARMTLVAGANVDYCQSLGIQMAISAKDSNFIDLFLEFGTSLPTMFSGVFANIMTLLSYYPLYNSPILRFYDDTRIRYSRLNRAISAGFCKADFKWQMTPVRPSRLDSFHFKCFAHEFNIPGAFARPVRYLKMELIKINYIWNPEEFTLADGQYDLCGNSISDLPVWQVVKLGPNFFNWFDLIKLIDKGVKLNPFTREILPMERILRTKQFFQQMLTRGRYFVEMKCNLLETIRLSPVPNEKALLRTALTEQVLDLIPYPPSSDIVIEATHDKLNEFARRLSVYFGMPVLGVIEARGHKKKVEFVKLLSYVVNFQDESRDTRIFIVSQLLY